MTNCLKRIIRIKTFAHIFSFAYLKCMCDKTRMEKVRNEDIRRVVRIDLIANKMKVNHLCWFDHLERCTFYVNRNINIE